MSATRRARTRQLRSRQLPSSGGRRPNSVLTERNLSPESALYATRGEILVIGTHADQLGQENITRHKSTSVTHEHRSWSSTYSAPSARNNTPNWRISVDGRLSRSTFITAHIRHRRPRSTAFRLSRISTYVCHLNTRRREVRVSPVSAAIGVEGLWKIFGPKAAKVLACDDRFVDPAALREKSGCTADMRDV